MASCLKCGARCAVHTLGCENDVMKDKASIDCETFIESTIEEVQSRMQERRNIFVALAVLKEIRKQES